MNIRLAGLLAWILVGLGAADAAEAMAVDLSEAVIVAPPAASAVERQALTMLIEEVEKRTGIRWSRDQEWPKAARPVIVLGTAAGLKGAGGRFADVLAAWKDGPAEGYSLAVSAQDPKSSTVVLAGNDARGVMFGIGRLLRELEMSKGKIEVRADLGLRTAPLCRLRGHQLGYRPKTNSYDAWDLPVWEQYIRDLIIFGCNAIELIPPRSDDDADSPHFPRPPMEMMIGMSRLADRYGLDVWIWYPAMDKDYADPATVQGALKEWGEVFKQLPRVDAVFVPGGDPGHTPPRHLMALLAKETETLHQSHPRAQMWVSPQSFNQAWMNEFCQFVQTQRPQWLSGIVFGPQVRTPLPALRALIPAQYPIRHYPDITHSRQCQYPVPDWDTAFAVTEARECINPRPRDEAAIFRAALPYTVGFITYSEGCNDDVNKAVWSALGWDPHAEVAQILREYSRYFIGNAAADGFAQGLLGLENNWRGPLLANAGVETTLQQFQSLERAASPRQLQNWRFQQGLFRAYYDAYTRRRLVYETGLEQRALDALRQAAQIGSQTSMAEAERTLNLALSERVAPDWHEHILELGAALFQSIGMQLSVSKYQAIGPDRGASLETLDFPLNNRPWLQEQFARIRRLNAEPERVKALDGLLSWENPGPGGFYDDLGNSARQPHLVRTATFAQDPGSMRSPRADFEEDLVSDDEDPTPVGARRVSWIDHIEALYDAPLQLRYTDLDPTAQYRVRMVYGGDSPRRKIKLLANDDIEVHPYLAKPLPFRPLEFVIPRAATASGTLTLTWSGEPGLGGNGRNCQVSEVWLSKTSP